MITPTGAVHLVQGAILKTANQEHATHGEVCLHGVNGKVRQFSVRKQLQAPAGKRALPLRQRNARVRRNIEKEQEPLPDIHTADGLTLQVSPVHIQRSVQVQASRAASAERSINHVQHLLAE